MSAHSLEEGLQSQFECGRFVPLPATRNSIEMIKNTTTQVVLRFCHEGQWLVLKQESYRIPRVRYGGPFSGLNSEREFDNLRKLRALGIPVVEPLCYGTSGFGPFLDRSFLVMREFTCAIDLRAWSTDRDSRVSLAQLHDTLLGFAVDLARLHRLRHYVWTMYAKNILVRPNASADGVELALCDVPRLVHWPRRRLSIAFAVRDLGALDKWGATAFPLEARLAFLKAYLDALGEGPSFVDWCRRIERRVDRLNHRTPLSSAKKRLQRGIRSLVRGRQQEPWH
jgi:hypothetical protein